MSRTLRLLGSAAALTVVAVSVAFLLQERSISASPAKPPEASGKIDSRSVQYVFGKITDAASPAAKPVRAHEQRAEKPAAEKPAVPVTYGEMHRRAQQESVEGAADREEKHQQSAPVETHSGQDVPGDVKSSAPGASIAVQPFSFGDAQSEAVRPSDSADIQTSSLHGEADTSAGAKSLHPSSPAVKEASPRSTSFLPHTGDAGGQQKLSPTAQNVALPGAGSARETQPIRPAAAAPLKENAPLKKADPLPASRKEAAKQQQSFDRVVTSANFVLDGSLIKLVLRGNAPMVGHFFQLHEPERVVLDIAGRWRIQIPKVPSNRLIQSVRVGRHEDKTRLVFDMKNEGKPALVPLNRNALELHIR